MFCGIYTTIHALDLGASWATSSCTCMYIYTLVFPVDEMEFEVGMDHRTSKLIARRLVTLPSGTVSFESMGHERLLGKVDSEPCLVRQLSRGGRTRVSS